MSNDLAEKRKQEMARRKAAAEARQREVAAKKKKKRLIIIAIACAVVLVTLAIAVPIAVTNATQYKAINFRTVSVPTTAAQARGAVDDYNQRKVTLEGYLFPCGKSTVLCKEIVSTCPYVTGSIPTDSILVRKREGIFGVSQQYVMARVSGTLVVSSGGTIKFEDQETYMYMLVDKVEVLKD